MISQDREVSEKDGPHRIKRFILLDLQGIGRKWVPKGTAGAACYQQPA